MLISCFLSQSCILAGVPEKQKTCYPIKTQEGQAIKELSVASWESPCLDSLQIGEAINLRLYSLDTKDWDLGFGFHSSLLFPSVVCHKV